MHYLDPALVFFISVLTACISQVEGDERHRLPPAPPFLILSPCHCYDEKYAGSILLFPHNSDRSLEGKEKRIKLSKQVMLWSLQ